MCARDGHVRSCERDMARRHVASRYIWNPGTTGYYPAQPCTTGKVTSEQSPGSPAISSELQLSVIYVRLNFNTLSMSTLRATSNSVIYLLL
eukprot:389933-Amorphochlora_amoeboformis.AAC.1